ERKQAQVYVAIHPDFRRLGYASEAVAGILSFVFDGLHLHRVTARCDHQNQAARQLLLQAGLRLEGEFIKDTCRNEDWTSTSAFGPLKEGYDAPPKQPAPA